ncbi:MAG: lipopolysaccharide transport periplasmic protein LptA [endosymbiont of Galathealinum brachiosum]|uniref:Lipopolysaccharide export system protein LptA n=1 Tax=endosymbiont of Galathealinum brachiosum TaxID=2200906 RepID=A0A370D901_9GAMM|nr:MAG: lipopolysaccharide transport periplasmic protein LptA [endosymbiont of Galathealinum brachiosum]
MKQLTKLNLKLIFLFLLSFSFNSLAKSTDKDAPLHIEADQLEMREKDNISIYKGHVKISKGSMKITGDEIIIKNKDGSLHKIHIMGKPATFYQLNDLNEVISAEGHLMDYKAKTGILELKEKALLVKNKNRFSSEHIIYNTLKDIVKAGNHKTSTEEETPRVKITIYPETKNNK